MTPRPAVWFGVPDHFTPIDMGVDPGPRVGRMLSQTRVLADTQRAHLVLAQEQMIEKLVHGNVVYAATSLAWAQDVIARPTIALFTVAVQAVHVGGDRVLDSIAARLADPGLRREVGFVPLPAGRALAVIEERTFTTATTVLGEARRCDHAVRQAQLFLPFPDRRRMATLSLSTEFVRDFEAYVDLLGAIAASLSFDPPGGGADGDVPPVGRIAAALDVPVGAGAAR